MCKNWLVYLPNDVPTIRNIFSPSILTFSFLDLVLVLALVFFYRLTKPAGILKWVAQVWSTCFLHDKIPFLNTWNVLFMFLSGTYIAWKMSGKPF